MFVVVVEAVEPKPVMIVLVVDQAPPKEMQKQVFGNINRALLVVEQKPLHVQAAVELGNRLCIECNNVNGK